MPQARQRPQPRRAIAARRAGMMWTRLGATFLTGAGLFALFGGYCFATRSLHVQPLRTRVRPETQTQAPAASDDVAAKIARQFLPEHPWAATARNKATSVDKLTYWYCQVWKQESDTVISLQPFALVTRRKDAKPGDRPYSVASGKAYITFAAKISMMGGNPGAIVSAELEGAVLIEGPNNLRIDGRNFYYQKGDPNLVYSDDRLRFRADRHFGSAKGMQLQLLRDPKAKPDEPISIGGINSIKLLQDVDMTLVSNSFEQAMAPPSGNQRMHAPNPQAAVPQAAKAGDQPQPVRCQSVGSFTFLPATHQATFERNVRIRRRTPQGKYDFIAADDNVKIIFDLKKPAKGTGAQVTAKDTPANTPAGTFDPNLSFKELHAQGKEVSLVSEANGLKAFKLHNLDYDRAARRATLSAAPALVQIWHNDDRLRAPYIQIDHDESGKEVTQIWCRGEGGMRHVDDKTHEVDLAAEWKKEMRKYADPKSGLDIVDLEEAMIEQPKEGSGIAADHISLFLIRQNAEQRAARPNMPPPPKRAQSGPQLHHLIALQRTEKVAMVSKQIEAESKRLEIWFQDAPPANSGGDGRPHLRANLQPTSLWVADSEPASGGTAPAALSSKSDSTEAVEPNPSVPRVTPGKSSQQPSTTTPSKNPKTKMDTLLPMAGESTQPYVMKADEIVVRVNRSDTNAPAQVSNVFSKGDVHLTQAQKDGEEPLVIDGDTLEVENRGPTDQQMIVHGQPGHVRNRGAHIEGSQIIFDRATNTADVDGAGKLQLPVKQAAEAGKPQRTNPFDVNWLSKMHFDGRTALFTGSVHSKLDDGEEQTDIRCKEMGVTLTKPFSFSKEHKDQDQDQPEIETIDCYGGVKFDSQSIIDHKLMEVRQGAVAQLTIFKSTGRSQAAGPGLLKVWRHNENGQSGMAQFANVQANSPPKTQKKAAWEYMQVRFDSRMDGDFRQMLAPQEKKPRASKAGGSSVTQVSGQPSRGRRGGAATSILGANGAWTTVFYDHVEVLYGPVEQPRETVSRDYLQDQSGWLGCDTLRVDQHPQTATNDQYITLRASGNSRIDGKDFFGESDSISYDGSKTLYVLRGDANRQARLWRQLQVGAEPSLTGGTQIFFDPVHHTAHQDAAQQMDFVQ
jgi:lipopolysaccharide export system protein LptA